MVRPKNISIPCQQPKTLVDISIKNYLRNFSDEHLYGIILPEAIVQRCSVKRYSKEFCKIYRKTPVPESLFNKVAGISPATLLKKRLWKRSFSMNFPKSLRTTFLQNTSGRLFPFYQRCLQKELQNPHMSKIAREKTYQDI